MVHRRTAALESIRPLAAVFAELVLELQLTPADALALVREESVQCAASYLRFRNGRPNQSRIAVHTGLSRNQVREILKDGKSRQTTRGRQRGWRVIDGWLSDPEFSFKVGKPKALNIGGARPSIKALVRRYAGDVTVRAVLDELDRMGAVRATSGRIELRSLSAIRSTRSRAAQRVIEVLGASLCRVPTALANGELPYVHSFRAKTHTQADRRVLSQRYSEAATAFMRSMTDLASARILRSDATRTDRTNGEVTVSLIVASAETQTDKLKPNEKHKGKAAR